MGMEAYLTELGLTERVLYDAQGNLFDPQAVVSRTRIYGKRSMATS